MHLEPAAHALPDDDRWRSLTASKNKAGVYQEDLHFRECWADAQEVLADDGDALLGSLALLSFKCDGVAGRRMHRTLDFLAEHGFTVAAIAPVRLDRHSMRELWRFNWHVYPVDRLNLMSVMHSVSDSVLLLLRDTRYDGTVPGSTRLAGLKGSADPVKRKAHELRAVLAPPNSIINFVHVADEPADVVRELGIFLDRMERRAALASARDSVGEDLRGRALEMVDELESRCPAHDFDLTEVLDRLAADPEVSAAGLDQVRAAVVGDPPMPWDELVSIMGQPGEHGSVWDFVCVAAAVLPMVRESITDLLPAASADEWRGAWGATAR